ncbi:protein LIFEGUARD 4-like isoform X2 [Cicer arietinum]|uniref:protein LIFEGUARD 4-like isoform X2 n=1 Tax=Cicer arietinum TaxID=3827 RepID=UPI003CC6A2FA
MWNQPYGKTDLESGSRTRPLYPMMLESPELRWSFIRKVYVIIALQLLATIAVGAVVVTVHPISTFFATTGAGLALYIVLVFVPFIKKVILEAVILTAVVVIALTLYTFWAARRGYDFNFLGPFLFGAVLVLMVFGLIQVFFPLGKLSTMIYGCLAAIIFCGYILYDTDNLIKRYSYDEFIWASVSLYLDIINLFLSLLTIFRAADS